MGVVNCFPAGTYTGLPEFTYTGAYTFFDDGDGNWRIRFLTSGTLVFTDRAQTIDLFMVGGGGGGGLLGGGGGGGCTKLQDGVVAGKRTAYLLTIGSGGLGGSSPASGGTTSAFGYAADGGHYGYSGQQQSVNANRVGGSGGSGGGGYHSGVGGTDGGDGTASDAAGGTGQGTTTREFHESAGTLYGTGGNALNVSPAAGDANTGNGGGSNCAGGSGIVVIRNHAA